MEPLPIDPLVGQVCDQLTTTSSLVLTAPPGSGKSTRIPPALCRAYGRTYLLQPRRIAAKALASRIAQEQQWRLGNEIGYRVRFERVGSDSTRLWVMTEGSLTRQLQQDPYLEGVMVVVLDEFHERSLHLDLALAYLHELQGSVRPDLKLVVMSATLDTGELCRYLDAPLVEGGTSMHPVVVSHASDDLARPLENRVASAVLRALDQEDCGDVLVFLPGAGEIRACERELAQLCACEILPLHGQLPPESQERALVPQRSGVATPRVILATNVAETSLTIPGVRTVIDSGLVRMRYDDPLSGIEELRLEPISRQSATQRAGRAGRTAPGRCVRLWTMLQDQKLPALNLSEVRRLDLSSISLTLKRLDYRTVANFPWFEPPEPARLTAATDLLSLLGAGSEGEALSPHGLRLAALPLTPRLGRLLIAAAAARVPLLGATLAALCSERDLRLRQSTAQGEPAAADALERLELLAQAEHARHQGHLRSSGIDPQASQTVVRMREELLNAWRSANPGWQSPAREAEASQELICQLLLCAFPDRVARRSVDDPNRATMVGGVVFEIDRGSSLHVSSGRAGARSTLSGSGPLLVAIDVQRSERSGRSVVVMRQGAEISEAMLEVVLPGSVQVLSELAYDPIGERVANRRTWRYRGLSVREASADLGDASAASAILSESLREQALAIITADTEAAGVLQRLAWLRAVRPDLELPDLTAQDAFEIMSACCSGCTTKAEVVAKPKVPWLRARLSREQIQALETLAPEHLRVPSGASLRLDYSAANREQPPILAVRLQELFGLAATPRLGTVPVLLHLLAPNYRVEQVTRDLASFWANTYQQVRKDLRGRYPKHSWPEDPLTAPPLAKGPSVKRS